MIFQDSLSSLNPKKRVIDLISEPLRNFENLTLDEEKRKDLWTCGRIGIWKVYNWKGNNRAGKNKKR